METTKKRKEPKYCRISRFEAIFDVRNGLLKKIGQIMVLGLEKDGYWTELTKENLPLLDQKREVRDFRKRMRPRNADADPLIFIQEEEE